MSRLISSWPVQLRDAATAGDPVHDDGADEIRPSPAEATRQARDADGLVHDFPISAGRLLCLVTVGAWFALIKEEKRRSALRPHCPASPSE